MSGDDEGGLEPLEVIDLEPAAPERRPERPGGASPRARKGPVIVGIVVLVALVVSVIVAHSGGQHRSTSPTTDAGGTGPGRGPLFPFRVGALVLTAGDDGLRLVDTDTGSARPLTVAGLPAGPVTIAASSGTTVAVRTVGAMYWFTLHDAVAHPVDADTAFAAAEPGHVWLAGDRDAIEVPDGTGRRPSKRVTTAGRPIGATRRGLLEQTATTYAIQPVDGSHAQPFLPAGAVVIGVHAERVAWVDASDCGPLGCAAHVTEVASGTTTSWIQLPGPPTPVALAGTVASFSPDGGRVAIVVPDDTITDAASTLVADLRTKRSRFAATNGYFDVPARPGSDDSTGTPVAWTPGGSYLLLAPSGPARAGRLAVVDPDTARITTGRGGLDLGASVAVTGASTRGVPPETHHDEPGRAIAPDAVPPPRPGLQLLAADASGVAVLDLGTDALRSITVGGHEPNAAGPHSIARITGGWLVVRNAVVDLIRDGRTDAPVVDEGTQVYAANGGRNGWIVTPALDGSTAQAESYDPATGALGKLLDVTYVVGASDSGLVVSRSTGVGIAMSTIDADGHLHTGKELFARTIDIVGVAGHEVLYESGTDLRAFDLTTGEDERLASYPKVVALSPDGTVAAWTSGAGGRVDSERFTDGVTGSIAAPADRLLVANDGTFLAIAGTSVREGRFDGTATVRYDGLSIEAGAELAFG